MVTIGITGGIGSGKSVVCNVIKSMGYPVFNADYEAKVITDTDAEVIRKIKDIFGNEIYINGNLNRTKVSALVFANKELLRKLNSVVHPAVSNYFFQWVKKNSNFTMVFLEAAILFESGANQWVDKVVVVTAPEELRIKRVMERDGLTVEDVRLRVGNQLAEKYLVEQSDFVIDNSGDQLVVPQVLSIIQSLQPK